MILCIIYVCLKGSAQSWPPASDASRSNKNDHHCFFDVCLTCLVGGYSSANDRARIDQLLRKLKRFGFCQKRLLMPRPWLVELMTASLSQFVWIQTTSCESIFLRQGLQTIIYALELTSSNSL